MKKTISVIALIFIAWTSANAQKNSLLVYGNLDYEYHQKTPVSGAATESNMFKFSPGLGYQFTDHWTAGLNLSTSSEKYDSDDDKITTFAVGPFVRYAQPLSDIFAVYGQLNVNSLSVKNAGIKSNGVSAELFPAIGVNLKNGFALNFSFGSLAYKQTQVKGDGEMNQSFGLSFGSGVSFGISKNFSF